MPQRVRGVADITHDATCARGAKPFVLVQPAMAGAYALYFLFLPTQLSVVFVRVCVAGGSENIEFSFHSSHPLKA